MTRSVARDRLAAAHGAVGLGAAALARYSRFRYARPSTTAASYVVPAPKRARTPATDEWDDLQLRLRWPEQYDYEVIRPVVLFGLPVADRADQTGIGLRTIARYADRFEAEGLAAFL